MLVLVLGISGVAGLFWGLGVEGFLHALGVRLRMSELQGLGVVELLAKGPTPFYWKYMSASESLRPVRASGLVKRSWAVCLATTP